MEAGRKYELAGDAKRIAETVTGHAHAAVNCMAAGPERMKAKVRIRDVRDMVDEFSRLTLELMPYTLEYAPDMPEAQLRAWAADLVKTLNGG